MRKYADMLSVILQRFFVPLDGNSLEPVDLLHIALSHFCVRLGHGLLATQIRHPQINGEFE